MFIDVNRVPLSGGKGRDRSYSTAFIDVNRVHCQAVRVETGLTAQRLLT